MWRTDMSKKNAVYCILLVFAFIIYSFSGVFTKLASRVDFLSIEYCLYFAIVILILAIYAVLWQIILKSIPLSQAYLFKSSSVIFSLLFASCLFGEHITLQNLVGASIIIAGIIVNSYSYSS